MSDEAVSSIRVGVVGLGYWGPNLARNFSAIPGCELAWLCDADEHARERLASSFPNARTSGELNDLLDDARLKAKSQRWIDWTLNNQAPSGMIGPASNDDWWPRIVMLKALTQYQEFTGDSRVIPVMEKYFRYQLAELPGRPLRDWS